MRTACSIFLAMLFLAAPSVSLAQDAREIMVKVDDVLNRTYRSSVRQMKFSTCRYRLAGGKLTCAVPAASRHSPAADSSRPRRAMREAPLTSVHAT